MLIIGRNFICQRDEFTVRGHLPIVRSHWGIVHAPRPSDVPKSNSRKKLSEMNSSLLLLSASQTVW